MLRMRLTIDATVLLLSGAAALAVPTTSVAEPIVPGQTPGYWLVGADGGVFSFNAPFYGSGASACAAREFPSAFTCATAIASTPNGGGYTVLTPSAFPVESNQPQSATAMQFGDASGNANCAQYFTAAGGPGAEPANIVYPWQGIASTPSGRGFWLINDGGTIATCGDASFFGQPGLRTPTPNGFVPEPSGIAATPDGKGYWVAASDGGVFAYGDAGFYGSMGGKQLNAPIVGIAATPDGKGYWLVASDGGIFAFGDAGFYGSMGGQHLNAPMVGIATNPDGPGYWTAAFDGGVFSFGDAPFEGSMGGQTLNAPILGITSRAG